MATDERTARALGYFSVGLGVAQIAAPGHVARIVGIRPGTFTRVAMRTIGVREIVAGIGILTQRRPAQWLWARAAGDVMDVLLTATSLISTRNQRGRVAATLAALAGITAIDAQTAEQITQHNSLNGRTAIKGITINRPQEDVEKFWREYTQRPDSAQELQTARFNPAPGKRGTEVRVEVQAAPAVLRVVSRHPQQQVESDLRRAKQLMEVGEVSLSEATAEGAGLFQGAAQPRSGRDEVKA
jgi:hypothetical protein